MDIEVPTVESARSALDGYTLLALDTDPAESLELLKANALARGIQVVSVTKRVFGPEGRAGFIVVTFDPSKTGGFGGGDRIVQEQEQQ